MIVMDKSSPSAISLGHFLGARRIEIRWFGKSYWRPRTSSVGLHQLWALVWIYNHCHLYGIHELLPQVNL